MYQDTPILPRPAAPPDVVPPLPGAGSRSGADTAARGRARGLDALIGRLRLRERLSRAMLGHLVIVACAVAVAAAGVLAGWLNLRLRLGIDDRDRFLLFVALAGAALFCVLRLGLAGEIDRLRPRHRAFARDLQALALTAAGFLALIYLARLGELFPRGWILSWLALAVLAVGGVRFGLVGLAAPALERLTRHRVALIGAPELLEGARRLLQAEGETELVASVAARAGDGFERALLELRDRATVTAADEIVLCLPLAREDLVARAVERLLPVPAAVSLCLDRTGLELATHGLGGTGGLPRMVLLDRPVRNWGRIVKGLVDRVGAAVLLLLLSPVFAAIACAIRLDSPGPVLFRQWRYGCGRRPFLTLKFRSMYVDRCDAADAPIRQATRADPRVTRVGRFLRRTSLDELPQLVNVLRGEMSLVGPRPHPIHMDDGYAEQIAPYLARHRVKPGMTGWAQVNGCRGETPVLEAMRCRIEHDLYYVRNWSLWLDLWILLLTPWSVMKRNNAW